MITRITPGCLGIWVNSIIFYLYDINPREMQIYQLFINRNMTKYDSTGSHLESSEIIHE